jgi:hypothetical protein
MEITIVNKIMPGRAISLSGGQKLQKINKKTPENLFPGVKPNDF